MKILKYRYEDNSDTPRYVTKLMPDDAKMLIGYDGDGNEVYDGDIVGNYITIGDDGYNVEHTVSAALSVTFTDEYGKTYAPKNFKCAL